MSATVCGERGGSRSGLWVILLTALAAAFVWPCSGVRAASGSATVLTPDELVEEALQREVYGLDRERRLLIEQALVQSPDCAPARWHSGQVRLEDRWVKVDDVPALSRQDQRYQDYLRLRERRRDTAEGHLGMGLWCSRNQLPQQARAHLARVIELDHDNPKAHALLGHRRAGRDWLWTEQIEEQAGRVRQWQENLARWKPKIAQIREALAKGTEDQQQTAKAQLTAISQPEAIPALEAVLGDATEREALLLVEVLGKMPASEASLALARQGVLARWTTVRNAAARELKSRQWESFVPELLAAMYTPIETREGVARARDRGMVHRRVLTREGQSAVQEMVVDTPYRSIAGPLFAFLVPRALWLVQTESEADQKKVARENTRAEELNRSIAGLLNAVSGQQLAAYPQVWWNWWNAYGETASGPKPVQRSYQSTQPTIVTPPPPPSYHSCFAAGTPVWTLDGLKPLEQVRIGDLVLAQDVETGRLSYKPVLRTTVRPAVELVTVRTEDEAFACTGGHLFWVCGDGWLKARRLRPTMALHCATGTVAVQGVEPSSKRQVHNLVVADFNSYFVGQRKVLVHDVTPQGPTTKVVPGLQQP